MGAMSKALAIVKDELRGAAHDFSDSKDATQLPDVITSTERNSIIKKIRHLELQQELDVRGELDISDSPPPPPPNSQITNNSKLHTEVELAFDLASLLTLNGCSITFSDFLILICLVENECLFDMGVRFIYFMMIMHAILSESIDKNQLLSFSSKILIFLSDNCSVKKRKKALTLIRQMDI